MQNLIWPSSRFSKIPSSSYFAKLQHRVRFHSKSRSSSQKLAGGCSLNAILAEIESRARSYAREEEVSRGISHFADVDVARARFNKDELMKIYGAPFYWLGNLNVMICFIHERSFQIVLASSCAVSWLNKKREDEFGTRTRNQHEE